MKETGKKQNEEGSGIRLFRDYVLQHYVNVQIQGADQEFLTGGDIVYRLRETIPELTIADVSKVLGEMQFDTHLIGDMAVWALYRIDGERELEQEFGLGNVPPALPG